MQVIEEQRDDIQRQFRDYQHEVKKFRRARTPTSTRAQQSAQLNPLIPHNAQVDSRVKAMTERNDDTVRRMHEERVRLETHLSQSRSECERYRIDRDQKGTQLEIMGTTLEVDTCMLQVHAFIRIVLVIIMPYDVWCFNL